MFGVLYDPHKQDIQRLIPTTAQYDLDFDKSNAKRSIQTQCVFLQFAATVCNTSVSKWFGNGAKGLNTAYISYDEKSDIQTIGNTVPDLLPVPSRHAAIPRTTNTYTMASATLMAGMNLVTGYVHRAVVDRHRGREFVDACAS